MRFVAETSLSHRGDEDVTNVIQHATHKVIQVIVGIVVSSTLKLVTKFLHCKVSENLKAAWLITTCLLFRVNCDKIMNIQQDFDPSIAQT